MDFRETAFDSVWLIELNLRQDERGFLARTFCEEEFGKRGLNTRWAQCNLTYTKYRGSIRGMHYQSDPRLEVKLIRCSAGAVFDVVVDVRSGSPTYGRSQAFELSAENRRILYVPAGFAHGFQCLTDNCELFYQMSEFYVPELARGIRWSDPTAKIKWPIADPILSERDKNLPFLSALA